MLQSTKIALPVLMLVASLVGSARANYPVGDLNADRRVDFRDVLILARDWLDPVCNIPGCEGNVDATDGVNMVDFALLAENWGTEGTTLVISEFMASNSSRPPLGEGDLLDEDGDSADWIEIYNPTDKAIDLSGWYLTDDVGNLTQWEFPNGTQLGPDEFLLVFASEKDRALAGSELHTNFALDIDGDYLALVQSDGVTTAHRYAPRYPRQLTDVSYGLAQHATTLVHMGAAASYHVPTSGDAGTNWTALGLNDPRWETGLTGIGFGNVSPGLEVTYYKANINVGHLDVAESVISNRSYQSTVVTETASIINYLNTGGGGHFGNNNPFPGTAIGDNVEHYVVLVTGMVLIPQAGNWTFGVLSDDGFGLRLSNIADTFTSSYPSPRGAGDTLAVFAIPAPGFYKLRLVFYECGGASELEFFAAKGSFTGFNSSFRLVGDTANGGLAVSSASADVGTDVQQQMQNVNASLWTRIEFEAEEIDFFDSLALRVMYEDGFVAYLNGVEVARSNFSGAPIWNSAADSNRPNEQATESEHFDISRYISNLRDGSNVLAIQGLNDDQADGQFLILPELTAAGSVTVPQYFATPTPGRFNVSGAIDLVDDTTFSHDRGFYDAPFQVAITCDTPGAAIHYTTDGSAPTETHGHEYTGPIPIYTTTCLRAMAFKPGWTPSNVDTQTYIFLEHVIRQPSNPAGFPTSWGSTAADYEMDPDVVNDPRYRGLMRDSLLSLPTMSIVTDLDNLFGPSGIYDNPGGEGVAWERPASVEWINPDGTTGFQVDAGLRIYGGAFRGMGLTRKKTFRLLFKRDYGPTKLRYPLFGQDAADEFDTIILRGGANDAWNNWGGGNTQYIIDEFMRRTQLALGHASSHGTFAHLYINGLYWGLYNPCERPQSSFAANYFGGDKEDWDTLNSGRPCGESNAGTWNAMINVVRQGLSTNEAYQHLQGNNPDGTNNPAYDDLLDVDNYIDYMFSNFLGGTGDWPGHNWYAGCRRPPNATGFKFFNWDSEGAIVVWSNLNANTTGVNNSAGEPYGVLRQNAEFCLLFADHVHRHLFNNGPATPEACYARYKELADQVELAIISESARWADQARSTPYTLADWQSTRNYILGTYMPQRSAIVLEQLRSAGLYPRVDAPLFFINGLPQHGGHISRDDELLIATQSGKVYYTTDGSDPRVPVWTSDPGDLVTLLTEDAPKRVLVPSVANGGNLLSNTPADFKVTYYKANISVGHLNTAEQVISNPAYQSTIVTEMSPIINYYNTGGQGHFEDDKPFPGTTIGSDVEDFVILATAKVLIPQGGPWTFGVNSDDGFGLSLSNGTDTFTSSHPDPRSPADTLAVFNITEPGSYDLRLVFYERGGGSGLELFAAKGSFSMFSPTNFHLVGEIGSGGLQVGDSNVWFTNYFDDSSWTSGAGGVGYENGSGYEGFIDIDVGDQMYDQHTTCYIRIPFNVDATEFSDMVLKARYDDGFIAYINGAEVARRNFTGSPAWDSAASAGHSDGAAVVFEHIDISEHVGALWQGNNLLAIHGLNVSTTSSDFLISVELIAGEINQGDVSASAIEFTEPITLTKSTHVKARVLDGKWSALNEATYAVGPVAENLRITEIMYHPQGPNDPNAEFIELQNIGVETLNLNLVRFTNGVDFTFPSMELAAGQYVMLVKDVNAFEAQYGEGFNIAGQYSGSLANGGEKVELEDAAGQTILSFGYKDGWYDITDGMGFSLTAKDPVNTEPDAWNDKSTWRPSANIGGSPGWDDAGEIPELGDVVINELLAHSHAGAPDWIELHSTTIWPIHIGGWFLSDSQDNLMKYEIAEETWIDPCDYIVFRENEHFGNWNDPGCHVPFALSENGETLYLHSGRDGILTGYSDEEKFGASQTGVALGRYRKSTGTYNFVAMSENTPGSTNAYPEVGPIVINEIMYHPPNNGDAEYVELLNISGGPVALQEWDDVQGKFVGWRFMDEGGVSFDFPLGTTMAADEYILLVRSLSAFESEFGAVGGGVQVFAWELGKLDNGSEKIQLSKPGDEVDGERYYVRVDRVNYSDGSHPVGEDPWPTAADGDGLSLARRIPGNYGNDVINWKVACPSPGEVNP